MRYSLRVSTVGQRYGVVHAGKLRMSTRGLVGKVVTETACHRDLRDFQPANASVTCRLCLARLKREGQ